MGNDNALYRAVEVGRYSLVLQHVAEAKDADEGRYGAIHLAARRGRADFVQAMLDAGANVNRRTEVGSTPLHFAVVGGSTEVVRLLIQRGADVNSVAMGNLAPVDFALTDKRDDIVAILIESGAGSINLDKISCIDFSDPRFGSRLAHFRPGHEASRGR